MAYNYYNQGRQGSASPYNRDYYDQQATSVAMPAHGVTVTTKRTSWNWCATVWASLAYVFSCCWCFCCCCCCCPIPSFISLMCLSHSYADHKAGDYKGSDYKKKCGIGWLVASWVLGLLLLVGFIAGIAVNIAIIEARWNDLIYKLPY